MPTIHLLIKGRVQGVYYRASAREQALALGLSGWVRNTPAGDVELAATGETAKLAQLEEWCRRGPEDAVVTGVQRTDVEEQMFEGFVMKRGN